MTDYERGKHAKHARPSQYEQPQQYQQQARPNQPRSGQPHAQQLNGVPQVGVGAQGRQQGTPQQGTPRYQYKGYGQQGQQAQQQRPQQEQPRRAAQPGATQAMPAQQQGTRQGQQPYNPSGQQPYGARRQGQSQQGTQRMNAAQQAQYSAYSRNAQGGHGYAPQGHAYPGQGYAQGGQYPAGQTGVINMPQKKKSKRKKVLIGVLIAVLVLIGAGVAFGAVYMNKIAGNMALSDSAKSDLAGVLSTTENPYEEPFYVLLVGSDNWESYGERSDALVLIRVDKNEHQITMVSVPRDTPYMLDGQKVKINQAFAEDGASGAVKAVEDLTGVSISYYAEIQFAGLQDYVDSIGGVTVDVPYTIDYQVYTRDQATIHIEKGTQVLDGEEAVALARMRTAYSDEEGQDAVRQSNVRALAMAMMNSIIKAPVNEIPGLVDKLSSCVQTSMDMNTMVSLATDFAGAKDDVKLYTCTGPYKGDIDAETGLWLCYDDPDGWKQLMDVVKEGGNPKEEGVGSQVQNK